MFTKAFASVPSADVRKKRFAILPLSRLNLSNTLNAALFVCWSAKMLYTPPFCVIAPVCPAGFVISLARAWTGDSKNPAAESPTTTCFPKWARSPSCRCIFRMNPDIPIIPFR